MRLNAIGLLLILGFLVAPLALDAQPRGHIPVVGVLRLGNLSADLDPKSSWNVFRQGLRECGYVEGQTIRLEYRYAEWQLDRLSALAAALVQLQPDVLVTNSTPGALAAKQATTTIPIVVIAAADMVADGIVASLARPGGNITGQHFWDLDLAGKRLELLKAAVPSLTQVAVLVDATNRSYDRMPGQIAAEAQALGVRLQRVEVGEVGTFDHAFATIARSGAEALLIMDSARVYTHRQRILEFARTQRLPTICGVRPYAEAGCLMAYAPDHFEMYHHAAVFVDKILHGTQPGDLPVERPAKFELAINLKTAQALGLTMPPAVLFQADEVLR